MDTAGSPDSTGDCFVTLTCEDAVVAVQPGSEPWGNREVEPIAGRLRPRWCCLDRATLSRGIPTHRLPHHLDGDARAGLC